jgi:Tfp pilus assembly protein PilF
MKKLIFLLVAAVLLAGCARWRPKPKPAPPIKPYETPTVYNFKKSDKNDAKIFQTMGLDYFKRGNFAQAQTNFKKAIKLDPTLYNCWYHLGLLNTETQEGYGYFKKTAELKPEFPNPYFWMAYYHCLQYEDKEASAMFKKYIELAANEPGEEARLKTAKEVLQELSLGKDVQALNTIRKPR